MDALKSPHTDRGDEKGGECVLAAIHAKGAAAGHGGLPVLPSALQRAAVSYLCADDVADVELVSKGGRELCKAHFETLRRFHAKGMAALPLMLRHSRHLRSFLIPYLSPARIKQLSLVVEADAAVELSDVVALRNCRTLFAAPHGTSMAVLSRCEQLQSLPVGVFGGGLQRVVQSCISLRRLDIHGLLNSPERSARLLAVRPLASLHLHYGFAKHLQAVVAAGAEALSALTELVIRMSDSELNRSLCIIAELLAAVKRTLTRLAIHEATLDREPYAERDPPTLHWELPQLLQFECHARVTADLTAPRLQDFAASPLWSKPLVVLRAAESAARGAPAFPCLRRVRNASVPQSALAGLTSVVHLDVSCDTHSALGFFPEMGFRYLLLAMPQLESLALGSILAFQALRIGVDYAAARRAVAALLQPFKGRPLEHKRLQSFSGDGFKRARLPALQRAVIDCGWVSTALASAPALRTLIVNCGSDGWSSGEVAAAVRAVADEAGETMQLQRLVTVDDEFDCSSREQRQGEFARLLQERRVFERCPKLHTVSASTRPEEFGCECDFGFDRATGEVLPPKRPRD